MARDILRSSRLRLRPFGFADGNHLFELDADPAVMRYLTGGLPTERSVIENEILPLFVESHAGHPLFGFWAAEQDGRFIGWFAFRCIPDDGTVVSLGFRFAARAWGQGFATEGARVLVDAGFLEHGVDRVQATTYQDNHASILVLERLGMRLHRRFRCTPADLERADTSRPRSGDLWPGDDLEFVLDRNDWAAGRPQQPNGGGSG